MRVEITLTATYDEATVDEKQDVLNHLSRVLNHEVSRGMLTSDQPWVIDDYAIHVDVVEE